MKSHLVGSTIHVPIVVPLICLKNYEFWSYGIYIVLSAFKVAVFFIVGFLSVFLNALVPSAGGILV